MAAKVWDIFGQDRSVSWKWSVNLSDFRLYIDAKILPLLEKNHVTRYNYTCHEIYISGWKKPQAGNLHCGKNLESNKTNLIMTEKDVISIYYPKMCRKIRCYVIPTFHCKNAHKYQKVLTSYHKNRYIYTPTDKSACDNTKNITLLYP